MCGIFGMVTREGEHFSASTMRAVARDLFLFSESRGKEAAGIAVAKEKEIRTVKAAVPASQFLQLPQCREMFDWVFPRQSGSFGGVVAMIGHSRLVTNGEQTQYANNQPVNTGRSVGVHNGIIVNDEALWKEFPQALRRSALDSEVIFSLIDMYCQQTVSLSCAVRETYAHIEGVASIAAVFKEWQVVLLATNNGSLFIATFDDVPGIVFASEEYILRRAVAVLGGRRQGCVHIKKIDPQSALLIDTTDLRVHEFSLSRACALSDMQLPEAGDRRIVEMVPSVDRGKAHVAVAGHSSVSSVDSGVVQAIRRNYPHDTTWQESLRRCTRCILPETMPFISFDEHGVCNYCRDYQPLYFQGADALAPFASVNKDHAGRPACVVGVSGGRDSLYALHYIKTVLGLSPVAYTYDWGMVTDLARRNISRICAKLGVEHIVVSADIIRKRSFIRQNVLAWLRNPHVGMIPLFMAGDKEYFYYLKKVRDQLGVELSFLGENRLERTDFKTGFAGIPPYRADQKHVYTLPAFSKARLALFYGTQYLKNPAYFNRSLLDTVRGAVCYYGLRRDFINLYNYIPWIEQEVVRTLRHQYHFELSSDTTSTWRIGDGTAAFYNYIYYKVAGFTENDTFRSNQIREGLISRDEALEKVCEENKPRYESIAWYLKTIQLDVEMVLARIAEIPTR